MLPLEDDPLAAEGLIHDRIRHFCKVYNFGKQWGPSIFPTTVDEENLNHIFGLSCKMNFSLNMIAVDSVENHHFVESLGIDVKNMKDKTTVVILDTKVGSRVDRKCNKYLLIRQIQHTPNTRYRALDDILTHINAAKPSTMAIFIISKLRALSRVA